MFSDCVNRDMRAIGTTKDGSPRQNWLEENCVCRSDPTTKWERLEEDEEVGPNVRRPRALGVRIHTMDRPRPWIGLGLIHYCVTQ